MNRFIYRFYEPKWIFIRAIYWAIYRKRYELAITGAWIGMILMGLASALAIGGVKGAATGMLFFILVWVGCGIIAIRIRRKRSQRTASQ